MKKLLCCLALATSVLITHDASAQTANEGVGAQGSVFTISTANQPRMVINPSDSYLYTNLFASGSVTATAFSSRTGIYTPGFMASVDQETGSGTLVLSNPLKGGEAQYRFYNGKNAQEGGNGLVISRMASDATWRPLMLVGDNGKVGIGKKNPAAKLDVAGEVKIGSSSLACATGAEGSIRYDKVLKMFLGCDGTYWRVLTFGSIVTPSPGTDPDGPGAGDGTGAGGL